MNIIKIIIVMILFFALCLISYIVIENYNQKWEAKDQSEIITDLQHREAIFTYSISILPKEQRNKTWLSAISAEYPSTDPNELIKILKIELPKKKIK